MLQIAVLLLNKGCNDNIKRIGHTIIYKSNRDYSFIRKNQRILTSNVLGCMDWLSLQKWLDDENHIFI